MSITAPCLISSIVSSCLLLPPGSASSSFIGLHHDHVYLLCSSLPRRQGVALNQYARNHGAIPDLLCFFLSSHSASQVCMSAKSWYLLVLRRQRVHCIAACAARVLRIVLLLQVPVMGAVQCRRGDSIVCTTTAPGRQSCCRGCMNAFRQATLSVRGSLRVLQQGPSPSAVEHIVGHL